MSEPCSVMYLSGSMIQGIPKKYSEKFAAYFPSSKNGMTESESTQKLFYTVVVHSKPSVEKMIYLLLCVRFIKGKEIGF